MAADTSLSACPLGQVLTRLSMSRGVTLPEMMVTISILAILSVVAVPTFNNVIHSNRLSNYSGTFASGTQLARGAAIKTNAPAVMCMSSDGSSCATTGSDWDVGWIVFQDTNGNGSLDAGEAILQVQQALNTDYVVSVLATSSTTVLRSLTFQATGVGSTGADIKICRATPSVDTNQRQLTLTTTGRITSSSVTASACP